MKRSVTKYAIFMGFALAFVMQACNLDNPRGLDLPTPTLSTATLLTPTANPVQVEQSDGLCSNPLFPVKNGATWTYASAGSLSGDYSFTDTITNVREDGFTLRSQFDDLTRSQEWTCTPGGLAALSFGGGIAGGLIANQLQMDLTTSNVQGVNLPKVVNPGDQWLYSLDFEGTIEVAGTPADTKGTGTLTFNALEEETVTVPAGTFNAMKIHVDMVLDMQVTLSGFSTPVNFTSPIDLWFAPGVGWVKANSSGELLGTALEEALELQSYSIP